MISLIVYSKPDCPYCEKFVAVMEHQELTFVEYKLGSQFSEKEFYQEFGEGATFPQVVLDGYGDRLHLGGCQDSINYLQKEKICCTI
jgi:glutaredoxin|tara:strand:- start:13568 stop:13828 length:261 start_codon:yes stop_codon:yes gene_type:complete